MAVYTEVSDEELVRVPRRLRYRRHCCPTRASPRASRTPTIYLHTTQGSFILTLYEKRVNEADLPFFLGLMQHLATQGPELPAAGARTAMAEALGRLAGRPGCDLHLSRRHRCSSADRAALRALSGRLWRKLHLDGRDFPMARRIRCRWKAGSRFSRKPRRRRIASRPVSRNGPGGSSRRCSRDWPADLPDRHHPRRSFHRQRVLHRPGGVGPDRLLFRLHGRTRLRRRDLPQRVVLRGGWIVQPHQGTRAAGGLSGRSPARCSRDRCVAGALPRLRMRFMLTRLVDWLNVPPGALVKPKDPLEYDRKLHFHRQARNAREYGLAA